MFRREAAREAELCSPSLTLDDQRRASWLKSDYSDSVWYVSDSDDDTKVVRIEFAYRLADGRCLTESKRLYATVKEFAWFVRDPRFSKIDSAKGHRAAIYAQLAIAHALSLRGIASYSHLEREDVEDLIQESRLGVEGLLQASARLAAHLEQIESDSDGLSKPYRSFPVRRTAKGYATNILDTSRLLADCNLPKAACYLPRVNWLVASAALRNGMSPSSKQRGSELPPPRNVSKQQVQRFGDALDLLFAIRRCAACEVPGFRPFPNGVWKTADRLGTNTSPTPVPPPRLVLHLLQSSAEWVGIHSPTVLACVEKLEAGEGDLDATLRDCRKALPTKQSREIRHADGDDRFLISVVEMLVTACWVIIAAFTARRYEETIDLEPGSLLGNDEEGWWLSCLISKTTRTRELIPVPLIVARAVEVLVSLSATSRGDETAGLFRWRAPLAVKDRFSPRTISPNRLVNKFARLVETPPHEDEAETKVWHWIPRQFRRFFAVLYFYRYEGADIAALSYFLRHFDIETTRGYVTRDPEAAKIWRDVEKSYVRGLADTIANGEREVGGAMGERLRKLSVLIKSRLEKRLFVSDESVGSTLQHIMERGGLVITPKAWVTCTSPRTHSAAKKARCRMGQPISSDVVGPLYAVAGPTVCSKCHWALLEPSKRQYADRVSSQIEESLASNNGVGTLFRELETAQLVDLRRFPDGRPKNALVGQEGEKNDPA